MPTDLDTAAQPQPLVVGVTSSTFLTCQQKQPLSINKDKNFTWKISKGDLVKIDTRDDHDKLENVQSLSMFSLGKKIAKGKP